MDHDPSASGLDRGHAALRRVAQVGAWFCGALLLLVSILVVIEILGRNFLGARVHGAEEIAGYVFAVTVAWGFGYCLLERTHIRLDFLYARLGDGLQRLWDALSLLSMLALSVMLGWRAWLTFAESWRFDSTSTTSLHVPLWIPQLGWVLGLLFFALVSLFMSGYVLVLIIRRRHARIAGVAGVPGVRD